MISINTLTKHYISQERTFFTAIKDISFDVRIGEIVCVVGPSGCGKSTILKCLTGIDQDYEGTITLAGIESKEYLKDKRIGLVSQKYSNFPWLTVYENVAIGFYNQKKSAQETREQTDKLLKRVGLFKVRNTYIQSLSGGMQQRVSIARTLAQNTEIIAFDEPFGALDTQTRSQMQEFLLKLREQEHKTIILVTHDIDEAIYLADRVVVLGSHPGSIRETITINIPKPRRPELRFCEEFVRFKKHINYIIRSESIRAALEENKDILTEDITIGLYMRPGNAPLYYAKDAGLFIDKPFQVELINFYDNDEKISLRKKGKLDVINITLDKVKELKKTHPDLKILKTLNRSFGADALVAQDSIKSIGALSGKIIGIEQGSAADSFLHHILSQEGMSLDDVSIQHMGCGEIGAAILSGQIDAGILRDPWLEKLTEPSHIHILKTTKDYPVLSDVLIARNHITQQKEKELQKICEVWDEALGIQNKFPGEFFSVVASYMGVSEEELCNYWKNLDFL